MNKKANIQTNVEQAMQSLEGIQSASPGAFFFTRVQARMNKIEQNIWEIVSAFIARPVVAFLVICLVVVMNVIVVFEHKQSSAYLADQPEQSLYDDDFTLASTTFYDDEITEP